MMNIFGGRVIQDQSESNKSIHKELPSVNRKQWALSLREEQPHQLKLHVYNFLITEGHFDIAETFAQESGLSSKLMAHSQNDPRTNQGVTSRRLEIKMLVRSNKIDEAIQRIASFEMEGKDESKEEELIFSLLCLKVVNLIRDNQFQQAISTAKRDVLPLTKTRTDRVATLEKVMSLIAYTQLGNCPNSGLLNSSHKLVLAEEVNTYLLGKNSPQTLKHIIGMGRWLERRLENHLTFPHLNPWSSQMYH